MNKIAVLLTCFNRKSTTLRCLERLFILNHDVDVYLVDDNSTDGTSLAIEDQFPQVNIIKGSGNLFWNRGMHLAWMHAEEKEYSHFLWLNDDVILYDNSFSEILDCSRLFNDGAIISGIIESHDGGEILYGGTDKNKKILKISSDPQIIRNMNGNVVLIPISVFNILGNLDPVFHHDLGDVDYGLRAARCGVGVYSTRVAIGSGDKNYICRVRLWDSNLLKRFHRLYSPLGSNPKINFYFRRKNFGLINASAYFLYIHLINLIPDKFIYLLFGDKYCKSSIK